MNKAFRIAPFIGCIGAVVYGCSAANGPLTPLTEKPTGRLVMQSVLPLTAIQIQEQGADFPEKVKKYGWNITNEGLVKEAFVSGVQLTNGSKQGITDEKGYFHLDGNTDSITVVGDGRKASRMLSRSTATSPMWKIAIPLGCKCTHAGKCGIEAGKKCCGGGGMDNKSNCCKVKTRSEAPPETPEGDENDDSQPGPDPNACLDYNGPLGNNQNLPPGSVQGIINFVGSDCDQAFYLGQCWIDLQPGQNCVARLGPGGCSNTFTSPVRGVGSFLHFQGD
jgi:hypothetical protein